MSASVFAFHSTPWNLTNLPQWMAHKTLDNLYGACEVTFDQGDLVPAKIGDLVLSVVDDPDLFRDIDWGINMSILDRAYNLGQNVVFGNFHRDNLVRLQNLLGDRLVVIAVHWQDQRCRELFAQCFAALHWHRLQVGEITMTLHDIEVRESGVDPVAYYSRSFLEHGVLPWEMPQWTDHSIAFQDFL